MKLKKTMKKNKKNILIIVFIIFVIFVGLVLIGERATRSQEEQEINQGQEKETEKESSNLQEEYPNNLLEGVVKVVDIENRNLTLEAKTGLIKASQNEISEKIIKITESTICEIYHIDTEKIDSCQFSEIAVDDNIVVMTIESTYDGINNLEEFTAQKISKRVN